ncbi:MAG TPA: hypothetical protein DCM86_15485 [Verrucomicrobiales bacterium]|nr:hypothetical protein [Verrucomicrobiales bacterium]
MCCGVPVKSALLLLVLLVLAGGIDAGGADGRLLASSYCALCHAVPDPSHLDRQTWQKELLPKMRYMAGLVPPPTNGYFSDLELLLAEHYFPDKPLIPADAFEAIAQYFVAAAPEKLESIQDKASLVRRCAQFTPEFPPHTRKPPLTTMTRIDPEERLILMGDATLQGIDMLDPHGGLVQSLKLGNIPTAMAHTGRGFYFACIGHFFPRDQRHGQVLFYEAKPDGLKRHQIGPLMSRLSDIQVGDLNGDGREDFVLCTYGNMIGKLAWWEGKGGAEFEEHILLDKPGSLRSEIVDLNGDGHPDIAVLVAQALESFYIFTGDGKGGFTRNLVFQRPPSWGHSGFQLVDFNGDGRLDILVTNGDNADFNTSPPKPYHGIRIYLNDGGMKFHEAWFAPMNGAYRAIARDFDHDGDLDIAAISFFPDYERTPEEAFIYFENTGGRSKLEFAPSTLVESLSGRWLTMEAGDVDGDGDDDLVLGTLMRMPARANDAMKQRWEQSAPSVLILRNNLAGKPLPKP